MHWAAHHSVADEEAGSSRPPCPSEDQPNTGKKRPTCTRIESVGTSPSSTIRWRSRGSDSCRSTHFVLHAAQPVDRTREHARRHGRPARAAAGAGTARADRPMVGVWADLGRSRLTIDAYAGRWPNTSKRCERHGFDPVAAWSGADRGVPAGVDVSVDPPGRTVAALDSGAGLANAGLQQRLVAVRLFYGLPDHSVGGTGFTPASVIGYLRRDQHAGGAKVAELVAAHRNRSSGNR